MPSEVKVKAEEPPRALREVDRLTRKGRNPEKLANTGIRCWKETLDRKKSPRLIDLLSKFLPYRRGLVTAWQKDQEAFMKWNQTEKVGNDVNGPRTCSRQCYRTFRRERYTIIYGI